MTKDEAVKAFREKTPVMLISRVSCGPRSDIEYDCISAVILRYAKSGHEIIQLELLEKRANCITITKPEFVYRKGETAPPFPKDEDLPPIKYKCGKYENVILTVRELEKLEKLFPDTYKHGINEVSEDIAVNCITYKNHFAAVARKLQA